MVSFEDTCYNLIGTLQICKALGEAEFVNRNIKVLRMFKVLRILKIIRLLRAAKIVEWVPVLLLTHPHLA